MCIQKLLVVTDLNNNETTEYKSIRKAAIALKGSKSGIINSLKTQNLGRYEITVK